MAQICPYAVEAPEILFKLHDKYTIFNAGAEMRSGVSLLATGRGLLFAGNPNAPEMKVAIISDLVSVKLTKAKVLMRTVQLPGLPHLIASSADGAMLAVSYTLNGLAFLRVYNLPTFIHPEIMTLYNLRLSDETNATARHLLWNPVLTTNLAVVLSNGALVMFTLPGNEKYEIHTLDKNRRVSCGCWSPKGKQIVLGFPNGNLQQYKPDLVLAKTIACPPAVQKAPFETIAVHWLSTYQFAAVFLEDGPIATPSIFIVNAPKNGTPTYTNYHDVCYSATGPRAHRMQFTHIPSWHLLLVASDNGVEIGVLGTKETGDTPTWVQYALLDEARIEMPITRDKRETFPIGFALDTSLKYDMPLGEDKVPVTALVYLLSTHGHLILFDFLNLIVNPPDIYSPPPPIQESSGQFEVVEGFSEILSEPNTASIETQQVMPSTTPATLPATQSAGDMSFSFSPNSMTSTPAKDKSGPLFGNISAANPMAQPINNQSTFAPSGNMFMSSEAKPAPQGSSAPLGSADFNPPSAAPAPQFSIAGSGGDGKPAFGGFGTGGAPLFGGFRNNAPSANATKPFETATAPLLATPVPPQYSQPTQFSQPSLSAPPRAPNDLSKPLYTVPPTFVPPATPKPDATSTGSNAQTAPVAMAQLDSSEMDDIIRQMMDLQLHSFDLELKQLANQSKGLTANIGRPDEMKSGTKRLNDLQEIIEQAKDRDFELDVQNLRHNLNEAYAMLAECHSKLEMYKDPDINRLTSVFTYDPVNRRQLAQLHSYLAQNQVQMQLLQQQIDAQWSTYQDLVRRNSNLRMHIPHLDGIYKRMGDVKDMMAKQRMKLNAIKEKLKEKGLLHRNFYSTDYQSINTTSDTMCATLADSMLSMSLSQVVNTNRSKLTEDKLNAIRNLTQKQPKITIIKPQRPNRVGLRSEVILETKLRNERRVKESTAAATTAAKAAQKPQSKTTTVTAELATPIVDSSPSLAPATQSVKPHAKATGMPIEALPQTQTQLPKPTATKPMTATIQPQVSFAPPLQLPTSTPSFSFGGTSPFVKTPTAMATSTAPSKVTESAPKVFGAFSTSGTGAATSALPTFGSTAMTPFSFGLAKTTPSVIPPNLSRVEPAKDKLSTPLLQTPISFSPKVIGGAIETIATKPPTSFTLTTATSTTSAASGFAALSTGSIFATSAMPAAAEAQKSQDAPKPFSFKSATDVSSSTASNMPSFGNMLAGSAKPVFSSFDAKPVAPASTSSSSTFSFTGFGASTLSGSAPTSTSTIASQPKATTASTFSFAGIAPLGSAAVPTPASEAASNTIATSGVATTPTPLFGGLGQSIGDTSASIPPPTATSTSAQSTASNYSFGALNLSTAPAASVSTAVTTAKSVMATSSAPVAGSTTMTATTDSTANMFGALNVCQPTAKEADLAKPANIFSGFGSGSTGIGSTFSFAAAAADADSDTKSLFAPAASTPSSFPFGAVTTGGGVLTTAIASSADTSNMATMAVKPTATAAATAAPATSSAFSFGSLTTAATATNAPNTSAPTGTSLFSGTAPNTGSMFGGSSPASGGTAGLFENIPKPDKPLFGATSPTQPAVSGAGTGLFAAAAAANPLPFGSPTGATNTSSGGNIFSGGGAAAGQPTFGSGGSIFGGAATATSPFAVSAASPTGASQTSSIFGGSPGTGSGGSIFGRSAFSQPAAAPPAGGSLFGPAAAQPQQPTGFGTGGSIFGGGSATSLPFGAPATATSGFGSFSQPSAGTTFGSPTSGGFAQGGASVAQSGFGSPQQASAFAKPVFSPNPGFGSPPSFGTQPSFGGAPTFGSPKGFGSFAAPPTASPGFGGISPQKNNLFETLGSSDTGISFGNLAQTTNAQQQKSTFGGSSFMNYRS